MEEDSTRNAEGKPKSSMALPEGGNTNERIYAALGSTEGLGAHLKCMCTNACSMRNRMNWKCWSFPRACHWYR